MRTTTAMRIWQVAFSPFKSGMVMSISTDAGRSFLALVTAWGTVHRFADNFQVVFEFQYLFEFLAHDLVIVRQQDSNSSFLKNSFTAGQLTRSAFGWLK